MSDVVVDMNIRLGDLLIMGSMAGSVLVYAFRAGGWKRDLDSLKGDVAEVKEGQKEIAGLLTDVAVQTNRLNTIDQRLAQQDQHIDDLRRGDGLIVRHAAAARG